MATSGSISTDQPVMHGEFSGELHFGVPGENGGYYTPSISQVDDTTVNISFAASKDGMAVVQGKNIALPRGGPAGPQGPQGEPGKSAYEYAQDGGFAGTEADFIKKISGEYLPISGGDMEGPINMNGQPLSGLNAPTEETQAANKGYVDGAVKKAAPPNLLANSYWAKLSEIVNQRGVTSYSGSVQYTIDCWGTTNANTTVEISDEGVVLTNTTDSQSGYLLQIMESPESFLGKTLTLACETDGEIIVNSCTLPSSFPTSNTQYAILYHNGETIGSILLTSSSMWVRVWSKASENSRTFKWVALYPGEYTKDTVPECQPKEYTAELAECQRQYLPLNNYIRYPATRISSLEIDFLIPVPVKMRLELPTLSGTFVVLAGTTQITDFTFTVVGSGYNAVAIRATKTAHGLASADNVALQVSGAALSATL